MTYILTEAKIEQESTVNLQKGIRLSFSKLQISTVYIYDLTMQKQVLTKKIYNKYKKLLKKVIFYVEQDDETGTAYEEALNEIEKFRLIVKNKYRKYMLEQELKEMSKNLSTLQKKAIRKIQYIKIKELSYQQELGRKGK